MPINFPCEQCGQRYQVDATLAGKRMKCKKCEAVMRIPGGATAAPATPHAAPTRATAPPPVPKPKASAPAGPVTFTLDESDDPYGLDDLPPAPAARKPAGLDEEDDLAAPIPRGGLPRPGAPAKKKKKKGSGDSADVFAAICKYIAMGSAGLLAVGLAAGVVGMALPASKYAAMIFLGLAILAACLMCLMAGIWGLVTVFTESVICGLMYLFVPFYGLIYLITRWDRMRGPFLNIVGAYGLIIGCSVASAIFSPVKPQARAGGPPMAFNPGAARFQPPPMPRGGPNMPPQADNGPPDPFNPPGMPPNAFNTPAPSSPPAPAPNPFAPPGAAPGAFNPPPPAPPVGSNAPSTPPAVTSTPPPEPAGSASPFDGLSPRSATRARQLAARFGNNRIVSVRVTGLQGGDQQKAAGERLGQLVTAGSRGSVSSFRDGILTVVMAPVPNVQAFAGKIDFGTTSVNGRVITVTADPSKLGAAGGGRPAGNATARNAGQPIAGSSTGPRFRRDAAEPAAAPALWQVQVDPPAEPVAFPAGKEIKINVPNGFSSERLIFPSTRSAFVCVGTNDNDSAAREVWDLRGPSRAGRLIGRLDLNKPIALSADGQHLAGLTHQPRSVSIYHVPTGKRLGQIEDGNQIPDVIDFAGPNRVIYGTTHAKKLKVFDFADGQEIAVINTPTGFQREGIAFSPNRRYVALHTKDDNRLRVYDTTTGGLVGEDLLPKQGGFNLECKGLAFSADGKELAGLYEETFKGSHLIVWDVAAGRQVADHFAEDKVAIKNPNFYDFDGLQWLPDGSGWLAFGQFIVERQSGQKVWTLPFDDAQKLIKSPRRILDADRALVLVGDHSQQLLRTMPLAKDKMTSAMTIARSGGNAADAALPPLKEADTAGARTIAPADSVADWSATPDPSPSSRSSVVRSVNLKAKNNEVGRVLISGGSAPRAFVTLYPGGKPFGDKKAELGDKPRPVERFDLAAGRSLGRFEVPAVAEPRALSPDGRRLLLADFSNGDRVDVVADDGKPLASWRPYGQESGDARQVAWADFLAPDRVLTLSKAGTLALWELPACKAVYLAPNAGGSFALLSPGRKLLAVPQDGAFRLIDPATGATKGETAAPSAAGDGPARAAFRPDGAELAAVVNNQLVRWDLTNGRIVDEFRLVLAPPLPGQAAALQYAGPKHILADNRVLVDLDHKRPVWLYNGGPHAEGSPDGAHWFVGGNAFDPASLTSIQLPEPKVVAAVNAAFDPKTKALLREGASLSIQVDGNPPRDVDGYRRKFFDGLANALKAQGAKPAENQSVRLVVKLQERDTGETLQLRQLGGGFGQNTKTIAIRNLEYEVSITDNQAAPIVLNRGVLGMKTFGITRVPAGENDIEGFIRNQLWLGAQANILGQGLPFFVARGGPGGSVVLPGHSSLAQASR